MKDILFNVVATGPKTPVNIPVQISSAAQAGLGMFNKSMGDTKETTKQLQQRIQQMNHELGLSSYGMQSFGQQAALASRRFLAFSAATSVFIGLTVAIRNGVVHANNFEKEMIKVAQTTGKSYANLSNMINEITKLSTSYGTSSEELSKVSLLLAQAGLSAQDTTKALKALALTDVSPTFENMTDTAEGAIAMMNQFGFSASELESKLSSLNAVAAAYAVESRDLITAFRTAGGAFKVAGGSIEELMALFTAVRSTTRESADSIATGFRTIFTRMQRPETVKFLKDMNINISDTKDQYVGAFKAVEQLSQALAKLPQGDPRYIQILEELGGYRQISRVIPMIQNFDVALRAHDIAMAGTNSLQEQAGLAMTGLSRQLSILTEKYNELFRSLTQSDTFKNMASLFLTLSSSAVTLAQSLQPILPMLTTLLGLKVALSGASLSKAFFSGMRQPLGALNTQVYGHASGGIISGSGNTDNTLIAATPGEFVVRKSSVQKLGLPFLRRINAYAEGGLIRGYENGDVIQPALNKAGRWYDTNTGKLLSKEAIATFQKSILSIDSLRASIEKSTATGLQLSNLQKQTIDVIRGPISALAIASRASVGQQTFYNTLFPKSQSNIPLLGYTPIPQLGYTHQNTTEQIYKQPYIRTPINPPSSQYDPMFGGRAIQLQNEAQRQSIREERQQRHLQRRLAIINEEAERSNWRLASEGYQVLPGGAMYDARYRNQIKPISDAGLMPRDRSLMFSTMRWGQHTARNLKHIPGIIRSGLTPTDVTDQGLQYSLQRGHRMGGLGMGLIMASSVAEPILQSMGMSEDVSRQTSRGIGSTGMLMVASRILHGSLFNSRSVDLLARQSKTIETIGGIQTDIMAGKGNIPELQARLNMEQATLGKLNKSISNVGKLSRGVGGGLLMGSIGYGIGSTINQNYLDKSLALAGIGTREDYQRARTMGTTANRIGNATTGFTGGAMMGATIGSFIGPWGTVIGGGVGGLAGAGIGALFGGDTSKQTAVYLNKVTDEVTNKMGNIAKGLSNNLLTVDQVMPDLGRTIDQTTELLDEANGDMRKEVLGQVAQQGTALRTILGEMSKNVTSMDDFDQKFGSSSDKLFRLLSTILDTSIPKLRESVEKEIKHRENVAKVTAKWEQQVSSMMDIGFKIETISASLTRAVDVSNSLLNTLSNRVGGGFASSIGIAGAENMLRQPETTIGTDQIQRIIQSVIGDLGANGAVLGSLALNYAKATQNLPGMLLRTASQSSLSGETFTTNIRNLKLSEQFGPEIGQYLEAQIDAMAAKDSPGKVIQDIINNPRLITTQLLKDVQGKNAMDAIANIYKERLDVENKVITLQKQYNDQLEQVLNRNIQLFQITADKIMMLATHYETPELGWRAQTTLANRRQNLWAGGLANNPEAIAGRITELERSIVSRSNAINNRQDIEQNIRLRGKEQNELDRLTQALDDLANSSIKLNVAQEQLSKATSDRKTKTEYLSSFVFGNESQRFDMARTFRATQRAAATNSLQNIPFNVRESISGFLDTFATIRLGMFGKDKLGNMRTGRDVKLDILANTARQFGATEKDIKKIYQSPEEERAKKQLLDTFNMMERANKSFGEIFQTRSNDMLNGWKSANGELIDGLDNIFKSFTAEAKKSLNLAQISDIQNQITTAESKKTRVGIEGTRLENIKQFFGDNRLGEKNANIRLQQLASSLPQIEKLRQSSVILQDLNKYRKANAFDIGQMPVKMSNTELEDLFENPRSKKIQTMIGQITNLGPINESSRKELEQVIRTTLSTYKGSRTQGSVYPALQHNLSLRLQELEDKSWEDLNTVQQNTPSDTKTISTLIGMKSEDFQKFSESIKSFSEGMKNSKDLWDNTGGISKAMKEVEDELGRLKNKLQELNGPAPAIQKAAGGAIFQPRGRDTIPAMLTPGEFIVNATSARQNRGVLESINGGARYMADGGYADSSEWASREMVRHGRIGVYRSYKNREVPLFTHLEHVAQRKEINEADQKIELSRYIAHREQKPSQLAQDQEQRRTDYLNERRARASAYIARKDADYYRKYGARGRNVNTTQEGRAEADIALNAIQNQNAQKNAPGRAVGGQFTKELNQSLDRLENAKFVTDFNKAIDRLDNAKLTINGTVNVNVNGMEAFAGMKDAISQQIQMSVDQAVSTAMKDLNNGKTPANAGKSPQPATSNPQGK